jgi:hypothetical protein
MYQGTGSRHRRGLEKSDVTGYLLSLWMDAVERWRLLEARRFLSMGVGSISYSGGCGERCLHLRYPVRLIWQTGVQLIDWEVLIVGIQAEYEGDHVHR